MARLDVLDERVTNHIKFFWVVVAFGFLWLGALTTLLIQTKSAVSGIALSQANVPAQIVASLLNNPVINQSEAQANLAAAASILKNTKIGKIKPDAAKLKAISDKLVDDQNQYPELPQVWKTPGVFINYKFQALLPSADKISRDAAGKTCHEHIIIPGTIGFENCEMNLEEVASRFSDNRVNGQLVPIKFVNCIVRYSGGALPDEPLEFQKSIMIFNITTVPPRKAIAAMRQLAQADTVYAFKIEG